MAENVRVIVRCRPMNKKEHESNCRNIVTVDKCSVSVTNPSDCTAPAKIFTFDSVYGELERTEMLYNEACYSLVDNVLEGYNGTIFAYGQTGCADLNYDETISTLRYASRAKNISNKPKINEDPKDAKLREYQEEIVKLKKLLEASNHNNIEEVQLQKPPQSSLAWLGEKSEHLKFEMQTEMENLQDDYIRENNEMEELKQSYEEQLMTLKPYNNNNNNYSEPLTKATEKQQTTGNKILQLEACKRIELIKQALIGGERANDTQLKEKRQKKKLDAQRRLSALAHVLSRVEQSEDRDILQGHYTSIQQELNIKNEHLKLLRQKNRALEREVSDLQVEFQLDRADYLETIRRLEKNLKFYQQIMDKALPVLRKDGKYWDPDKILENSQWNDELKIWKLPETSMDAFKLPLASSLRGQQFSDNALQKRTNSSNSLQSTLNNVSFIPVDYLKETIKSSRYAYSKNYLNQDTHFSAHICDNEDNNKASDKHFDDKTVYSSQNFDYMDLDKTEILQNYFRTNRRKHTADMKK